MGVCALLMFNMGKINSPPLAFSLVTPTDTYYFPHYFYFSRWVCVELQLKCMVDGDSIDMGEVHTMHILKNL